MKYYRKDVLMQEELEVLEKFVERLRIDIPMSSVWIRKRCVTKENTKLSFKELVRETSFAPTLKGAAKEVVAQEHIPFSVVNVGEEVRGNFPDGKNKMREVITRYLTIRFAPEDVAQYGEYDIESEMSLPFSMGEYEGRDAFINALEEDLKTEHSVTGVLLRKSGRFYTLDVAR